MYLGPFSVLPMRAVRYAGTLFRLAVLRRHRVDLRRILCLNIQRLVNSMLCYPD